MRRLSTINIWSKSSFLVSGKGFAMVELAEGGRLCEVLIVEDDQDDAYLLKRALKKAAMERKVTLGVTHSLNGLEGLGKVARSDILSRLPDVIVVDLNMPLVDGDRFLAALREDLELGEVPAAVLTTSTERPVHARALASGADVVFSKPNTQDELVEIARQILHLGGRRCRAQATSRC